MNGIGSRSQTLALKSNQSTSALVSRNATSLRRVCPKALPYPA
jgi:hypothetical protein